MMYSAMLTFNKVDYNIGEVVSDVSTYIRVSGTSMCYRHIDFFPKYFSLKGKTLNNHKNTQLKFFFGPHEQIPFLLFTHLQRLYKIFEFAKLCFAFLA